MFSRVTIALGIVLLPVLGIPAQASSLSSPTVVQANDNGSDGTDCFFEVNRYKPECQGK